MPRPAAATAEGPPGARELWRCIEPVHAVTYFAPESRRSLDAVGMRGFWMGYFAARAAPLGAVAPAVVSATFFNFHPAMVRRALPDAWERAAPTSIVEARRRGAAGALARLAPSAGAVAPSLLPLLHRVIDGAGGSGRPLFGANRDLDRTGEPVEDLWQACTCLREHRGDGHVAALTTADLDGCEALVLFARSEGIPHTLFLDSRGWSAEEWDAADRRLEARGLVDDGVITDRGRDVRRSIEQCTDDLADSALGVLDGDERTSLREGLRPLATAVLAADTIPFPNPMGLPGPGQS